MSAFNKLDPIKLSDFDPSKISYTEPRKLAIGKLSFINYNGAPLCIQTPELLSTFGASSFSGEGKLSMALSYREGEKTDTIDKFFNLYEKLDKAVFDQSLIAKDWFNLKGKSMSADVAEAWQVKSIKQGADKKYPPFINVKFQYDKESNITCPIFDKDRNQINDEVVQGSFRNSKVRAILQCNGVWIGDKKFSTSWTIKQLKVTLQERLSGYSFLYDSEDEEVVKGVASINLENKENIDTPADEDDDDDLELDSDED